MTIEITLSNRRFNTKYAPLAVLGYKYCQQGILAPLGWVRPSMKAVSHTSQAKLEQIVVSMLAGCEYISEVNSKLRTEQKLAKIWGYPRFADQSQLSELLNQLSLIKKPLRVTNLVELRAAVGQIWRSLSHLIEHDWRGFLIVDLDLSGLPSSKRAEGAKKGYMSGKKT